MRIEWTEPAQNDLDQIYNYIAGDSPYYAAQFIERIIDAVETLRDHSRVGR